MDFKYLQKNEFRYNENPDLKNKSGKGHPVYVTAQYGNHSKINVITHSNSFFKEPTEELLKNPQINKKDKRQSRFSVPRWEENRYIQNKPYGTWHMSNKDRLKIHKFNRHYKEKK